MKLYLYDAKTTGVPGKKAEEITRKLVASVAWQHKSNRGKEGWGDQWQSALWASQVAHGAWIIWDLLSEKEQRLVCNMLVHEADRFMNYKIPYYKDKNGNIRYKGDTKAEENAWNSNILIVAAAMMPHHPHSLTWEKRAAELQLSAFARPEDAESNRSVDGIVLSQFLEGSNMNSDGTVINHNIIHPDYMSAFMHNALNGWVFQLANKKPQQASLFNGEIVYKALTENLYNGKTMYQKTVDGKASPHLYFPEGNDWGGKRQANYWLMDVIAHINHWGTSQPIKAIDWAKERNKEMIYMLSRDTTGQYYQTQSEDSFPTREEWFGQHIAWGCLALWLNGL